MGKAKPRRAHFRVKHGVSGPTALPQNPGQRTEEMIYDDPSWLRTVNIQSIEPAKLFIDDSPSDIDRERLPFQSGDESSENIVSANFEEEKAVNALGQSIGYNSSRTRTMSESPVSSESEVTSNSAKISLVTG